ncbi:hypothetical protein VFPPC_01074 [Pochonia chlamydosporia 170]|uniref:Uncharacterized protein n=1 Tax=Pochonia chlamydosporia 170 TaxID=1380566 RepID=A0A179G6A1_METCM|nr:hypothetical protein VFPPC_01074 [Pochonia chlamydosporia 170]OAQ73345.2 hypothetical protein VFPPC_01074 [Pochonia chlamydosporia 170]
MSSLLPPLPHSPIPPFPASYFLFPPIAPIRRDPESPILSCLCLVLSFLVFSRLVRLIPAGNTVQHSIPYPVLIHYPGFW